MPRGHHLRVPVPGCHCGRDVSRTPPRDKAGVRYHLGTEQQGVEYSISTLVLYAGSGVPPDAPKIAGGVLGASFGLTEKEIAQIEKHKVAILHHGNVRSHVVHKVRFILQACDVKAIVVSQAPIDYEDLAKEGVKTAVVMPPADKIRTKGTVMAIVSA